MIEVNVSIGRYLHFTFFAVKGGKALAKLQANVLTFRGNEILCIFKHTKQLFFGRDCMPDY